MKKIRYIIYHNGKKILKDREFIKKYHVSTPQLILLKSQKEMLNIIMLLVLIMILIFFPG